MPGDHHPGRKVAGQNPISALTPMPDRQGREVCPTSQLLDSRPMSKAIQRQDDVVASK